MPNRILRPEINSSHRVDSLPCEEELFYRRLMSVVDDFGRFSADPPLVRSACYPLRTDRVSLEQIRAWMDASVKAGLLNLYQVEGKAYLEYLNLGSPRAKGSRYPAPDGTCQQTRADVTYSGSGTSSYSNSGTASEGASPLASESEEDLTRIGLEMKIFAEHITRRVWQEPDRSICKRALKACRMSTVGQACEFLERIAWIKRPQGAKGIEMRSYAFAVKLIETEFGGSAT